MLCNALLIDNTSNTRECKDKLRINEAACWLRTKMMNSTAWATVVATMLCVYVHMLCGWCWLWCCWRWEERLEDNDGTWIKRDSRRQFWLRTPWQSLEQVRWRTLKLVLSHGLICIRDDYNCNRNWCEKQRKRKHALFTSSVKNVTIPGSVRMRSVVVVVLSLKS